MFIHSALYAIGHSDVHDLVIPIGQEVDIVAVFPNHRVVPCEKISPCGRNDSMVISPRWLQPVFHDATEPVSGMFLSQFSRYRV